jgi:hypothetical protein
MLLITGIVIVLDSRNFKKLEEKNILLLTAFILFALSLILLLPELILKLANLNGNITNCNHSPDDYLKALFISSTTILGVIILLSKETKNISWLQNPKIIDEKEKKELEKLLIAFAIIFFIGGILYIIIQKQWIIGLSLIISTCGILILIFSEKSKKYNNLIKYFGFFVLTLSYVLLATELISYIIIKTFEDITLSQYLDALLNSIISAISIIQAHRNINKIEEKTDN